MYLIHGSKRGATLSPMPVDCIAGIFRYEGPSRPRGGSNASADDYLLGNNKQTVKQSKVLLVCSKQAGLEANTQNAV
jgi:hypothetical protein